MPVEPPSNGEYMVAAYAVASLILLGYWIRLWRMANRREREDNSVSGKRGPPLL